MNKLKKILAVLAIILISAVSGIMANRYVFPRMAAMKFFSKYAFFKKTTEDVTIINKTEQVYVKDDTSVSKIASQTIASVVNIISSVEIASQDKKNPAPSQSATIKNGTGLIVTSDGLIMTYSKAIFLENAKYKIITSDNNVYDATLADVDTYSNLAFLKIVASNLPAVALANSDDAIVGEKIIAIGRNDSGLNSLSFSAGILSALNYDYNLSDNLTASSEKLEGVFETDINREENYIGGPLLDYTGQVIGVVGMNVRDGKNIFFQIPSNKVKVVLDKEIRKELNTSPLLGVYYLPITRAYSIVNSLPIQSGVLIYSPSAQTGLAVIANSPAAISGLKLNDIITAVSGEKIDETHSLPDLLYKHKKGEELELTILRNLQEMQVRVRL